MWSPAHYILVGEHTGVLHRITPHEELAILVCTLPRRSHPGTASETLRVEVEGQQLRILLGAATPGDAARLRRLQERAGTAPSRSTSFGTTYSGAQPLLLPYQPHDQVSHAMCI